MNHLLVVVAGLLGGIIGFALSLSIALWLATAMGISARDGAHGYLGFIAGFCGGLVGMIASMVGLLHWQGATGIGSIAVGSLAGTGTIAAIACCLLAIYWLSIPKHLSRNGAPPIMHFEIRSSGGQIVDPQLLRARLSCDSEERPEVYLSSEPDRSEDGLAVIKGHVELYYRASWRLLSLELPDDRTFLFKIRYPADPTKSAQHRQWSQWYTADEIHAPSTAQPTAEPTEDEQLEIRYRIEFWKTVPLVGTTVVAAS